MSSTEGLDGVTHDTYLKSHVRGDHKRILLLNV